MFEKMTGSINNPTVIAVEESEAARLLFGHVRDVAHSLESLKGNPWSQSVGENCRVRWNPSLTEIGFELANTGPRCNGANCTGCGHMAAE